MNNSKKTIITTSLYICMIFIICTLAYLFIKYSFLITFSLMSSSDIFKIQNLIIETTDDATKDEILLLSGIDRGTSILRLNMRNLKASILRHPNVTDVSIKRKLPDTLKISLTTRNPIAIAMLDKFYYIDSNGIPYKSVKPIDNFDLPIITGISEENSQEVYDKLGKICRILTEIYSSGSLSKSFTISEINYRSEDFVWLYLKEPRALLKLYIPELHEQLAKLKKALAYAQEKGLIGKLMELTPYYSDAVALLVAEGL